MEAPPILSLLDSRGSCFLTNNLWQFHNTGFGNLIRLHAWCSRSAPWFPRVCENVIRRTTGVCKCRARAPDGWSLRVPQSFPGDAWFSVSATRAHTSDGLFALARESAARWMDSVVGECRVQQLPVCAIKCSDPLGAAFCMVVVTAACARARCVYQTGIGSQQWIPSGPRRADCYCLAAAEAALGSCLLAILTGSMVNPLLDVRSTCCWSKLERGSREGGWVPTHCPDCGRKVPG